VKRGAALLALALASASAGPAAGAGVAIDGVAVRFYASETGGSARPRFVLHRELAFEARLEMMGEGTGPTEPLEERYVREAAERHIAVQLLVDLPLERPAARAEIERTAVEIRAGIEQRVGGRERLDAAAHLERIAPDELEDIVHRHALAALYLERTGTPVLRPTEEQLREVFRMANHPWRGAKIEAVRTDFARWYVMERLLVAEAAYFQGARSRVRITYVG